MYLQRIGATNVTNCVLHAISNREHYCSRFCAFGMVGIEVFEAQETHSVDGDNL